MVKGIIVERVTKGVVSGWIVGIGLAFGSGIRLGWFGRSA